jgi:aerobic-type carbon monoxide dehydrogenase small subunit (CoxS/CutS family)
LNHKRDEAALRRRFHTNYGLAAYVLTNDLALRGPRFGCGLGQCGCCSVLVDGVELRSCITPTSRVVGKSVTTLEGLPAYYAMKMKLARPPALHPLQEAMIAEQAVQCGYCYNGQIIKGAELLFQTPQPTEAQIRTAMNGHICRCGTYPRIMSSIQRASKVMAGTKQSAEANVLEGVTRANADDRRQQGDAALVGAGAP